MSALRVVLADDHALVRAGIRALLEKLPGIEVVGEADNGRQALELITASSPNLILLDISMPGGNGFRLAETFHRMPETSETPIIFITASKSPELMEKVVDLGAAGLFEKPFDTEKLLGAIDAKFERMTHLSNVQQRFRRQ